MSMPTRLVDIRRGLPRSWRVANAIALTVLTRGRVLADDLPSRTDRYGDPLPAGAAVRLGTVRYRVATGQTGLAFAADNQTLVCGTPNREIVLLDVATGKRVREIAK